MPVPPFLSAAGIHKAFDDTPVLRGIDLEIAAGETVCLLGPSGCGKTTLLRIVAGLEQPDQGRVFLEGKDITNTPSHRRGFGLMFQEYVLFPHLDVTDNIAFGLRMQGWPAPRIAERVRELLELVELEDFARRRVFELSGGQQQRVALARSLAPEPRLLMLDEPLGSLDRLLRDQLLADLRQLLQRLRQTALYVTHDQVEAFAVADRVALMNAGQVEQQGAPEMLYQRPASLFAARFFGFQNRLPATVRALAPVPILETTLGELQAETLPAGVAVGDAVQVVIRPDGARPAPDPQPRPNRWRMRLELRSFRGAHTLLRLSAADASLPALEFEIGGLQPDLSPKKELDIDIDPGAVVVLPMSA